MRIEDLKAYEIIEKRRIEDLNSESYLLRHVKTGARVALLSNDDENKVFYSKELEGSFEIKDFSYEYIAF